MGVITILCPRTGQQVSTGVEVDRIHFDRMGNSRFSLRCWECGNEHVWSKRWATFVEDFPRKPQTSEPNDRRQWV